MTKVSAVKPQTKTPDKRNIMTKTAIGTGAGLLSGAVIAGFAARSSAPTKDQVTLDLQTKARNSSIKGYEQDIKDLTGINQAMAEGTPLSQVQMDILKNKFKIEDPYTSKDAINVSARTINHNLKLLQTENFSEWADRYTRNAIGLDEQILNKNCFKQCFDIMEMKYGKKEPTLDTNVIDENVANYLSMLELKPSEVNKNNYQQKICAAITSNSDDEEIKKIRTFDELIQNCDQDIEMLTEHKNEYAKAVLEDLKADKEKLENDVKKSVTAESVDKIFSPLKRHYYQKRILIGAAIGAVVTGIATYLVTKTLASKHPKADKAQ